MIPPLPLMAPHTAPPANPPMAALNGSFVSLALSAQHSVAAKAAAAEDIQKAGRAMARPMALASDLLGFLPKRVALTTGSGYHANWTAAKNVPAPAPTAAALNVLLRHGPSTAYGRSLGSPKTFNLVMLSWVWFDFVSLDYRRGSLSMSVGGGGAGRDDGRHRHCLLLACTLVSLHEKQKRRKG
eukprot:184959_1